MRPLILNSKLIYITVEASLLLRKKIQLDVSCNSSSRFSAHFNKILVVLTAFNKILVNSINLFLQLFNPPRGHIESMIEFFHVVVHDESSSFQQHNILSPRVNSNLKCSEISKRRKNIRWLLRHRIFYCLITIELPTGAFAGMLESDVVYIIIFLSLQHWKILKFPDNYIITLLIYCFQIDILFVNVKANSGYTV